MLRILLLVAAMLAVVVPAAAVADDGHDGNDHAAFGTVFSFNGRSLTITRADGRLVTATVTPATKIECENANEANDRGDDDHGDGRGDDDGNDNGPNAMQTCDRTSLQPGTVVLKAKLRRLDDGTRFFRRLKLAA